MSATHDRPPLEEPPWDPDYDQPDSANPETTPKNGRDRFRQHAGGWNPDQPPHDTQAERALLGALLHDPELTAHAGTLLDPGDFYQPRHMVLWNSIHAVAATGALPGPVLVLEQLRKTSNLKPGHLDAPYLHECMQAGELRQVDDWARIVLEQAKLRTAQQGAHGILHAIRSGRADTVDATMDRVVDTLDKTAGRFGATTTQQLRRHVETIDELLAGEADDTYDWVIPGLLEHQERVILTAEEGAGKSTLLRQIGLQAASGIHPFTGADMDPITVLHVDVENTRRQSRRRYRPMRIQAGHDLDPDRLRIELRTAGIDLTQNEDRDWLLATCAHVRPDLLIIGPIYKLANGDPTEEKSAKPVAMAIDTVRDATDTAVILEAHAAKAPAGQRRRPHEPYGWSGWLRWPEVGLWLDTDGTLTPWRGAREERSWPDKLERGGDWPWSPAITETADLWTKIRQARQATSTPMSYREVSTATGLSKGQVQRLIGRAGRYHYAWNGINGRNPDEPTD